NEPPLIDPRAPWRWFSAVLANRQNSAVRFRQAVCQHRLTLFSSARLRLSLAPCARGETVVERNSAAGTKVTQHPSAGTPGCNCDRGGPPYPDCVEHNVQVQPSYRHHAPFGFVTCRD